MLNLLGCLDRPTSGQYLLGGRDVSRLDDDELSEVRSRYLGFIFQSYNLIAQYTVLENIQLPLTYQGGGEISREAHQRSVQVAESGRPGRPDRSPADAALRRPAAARGHRPVADQRSRTSSWPTRRPETSTRPPVTRSWRCSASSTTPARPSSWSPTKHDIADHAKRVIRMHGRQDHLRRTEPAMRSRQQEAVGGSTDGESYDRCDSEDLAGAQSGRATFVDRLERVRGSMGRIWRALKLGMKSLLLHKLRSGLTVLGIVFGVAAVISMLAIAEGSSREAQERIQRWARPISSSAQSSPAMRPRRPRGRPSRILNYGLKYDDYERIMETVPTIKQGPAHPRDPQADPPISSTTSTAASSAPPRITPSSTCWRSTAAGSSPPPTTRSIRTMPCWPPTTAKTLFPYEDPVGHSVKLGSDYYTVIGVTKERQSSAGIGNSLAAQDFNKDVYIPLNTCKVRFGEKIVNSRSGSMEAEETQLSQITLQVGTIDEVRPPVPIIKAAYEPWHPRKDVEMTVPLRPARWRPSRRLASSASSWARSPPSRSWSAASAS